MFSVSNNFKFVRNNFKSFALIFFAIIFSLFFVKFYQKFDGGIIKKDKGQLIVKTLLLESSDGEEIEKNIDNQLQEIDFIEIDKKLQELDLEEKNVFEQRSFEQIVKSFLFDEEDFTSSFLNFLLNIFFKDITIFLPYFLAILFISILYTLISEFSQNKNINTKHIVYLVSFCTIIGILIKVIVEIIDLFVTKINWISSQMDAIFPILLTLITALGGVTTGASFQPILVILSQIITKIFSNILLPIFLFTLIFNFVGNISNNVKLDKFSKFFHTLFNWIIGIVFTIFVAILSIKGLTASGLDGISIKTAKYAIKSYIPIIGSYLSDGVSLILTSSQLIKNAVGISGLVVLLVSILSPIVKLCVFNLLLKLFSSLIEMFGDEKTANCLFNLSKTLAMLNTIMLSIGFMYLISISTLLMCSNIF